MIKRIEEIIRYKGFTSSKFADEIGVQRSGISHVLSGRNKPSLEFILKILDTYPELNTDWLLLGKGKMLKQQEDLFSGADNTAEAGKATESKKVEIPNESPSQKEDPVNSRQDSTPEIEKIIVLYNDKSFKEYGSVR